MKAGFVGLGSMGGPMARNLARAGYLRAVWNRTEASAFQFAREVGVGCTASPALLAAQVDIVLMCVSADADVLEVVQALLPALREGSIVIDCSTVADSTARAAAELVRHHGADFLDAPVTGGVEGAANGTLSMMVGGSLATLETALPLLETLASRVVHLGEVGSGQAAKAVNQVMAAGINQAVTEALAFGNALGLDMKKVIDVISGGAAGNWFLEKRGNTMIQGIYRPGFKLALHHKDLRICESMAGKLGFPLPLAVATLADYEQLIAEGYGDEDISALFRLKSK